MANATENVKKTMDKAQEGAERAHAAGTQAFREGVDKSLAGMTELNAEGKRNFEAFVESATAATRGAEALTSHAVSLGKKGWEDGLSAAQTLAQARSIQEVIELQTSFTKNWVETYLSEMTKATEIMSSSVKDSFKPINDRVTATVERMQSVR